MSPKELPVSRAWLWEWRPTVEKCFCCKSYYCVEFHGTPIKSLSSRIKRKEPAHSCKAERGKLFIGAWKSDHRSVHCCHGDPSFALGGWQRLETVYFISYLLKLLSQFSVLRKIGNMGMGEREGLRTHQKGRHVERRPWLNCLQKYLFSHLTQIKVHYLSTAVSVRKKCFKHRALEKTLGQQKF